jgi:hypothetical protein
MLKKIIWQKWQDPFAESNDTENEFSDEREYKDSYEKMEGNIGRPKYSGAVLVGPMGVIPINENASPGKIYNFWIMHTNFNIGKRVLNLLKTCPGVESLDVFTRYRARLSFGKVFNEEKVKRKIQKLLCHEEKKVKEVKGNNLDLLKKQMSSKYSNWAIAVTNNKQIKLFSGDSREEVEQKLNSGGNEYEKVHTSWQG